MNQPTPEHMEEEFKRLAKALQTTPLPHTKGGSHTGSPSEFMWMNQDHRGSHFKHIESRNYLTLKPNGEIFIPLGGPFNRGTFDPLEPDKTPTPQEPNTPFDPSQCSGAFDGVSVSSDADTGL
jgi:hypothetical protein